MFVTFLLNDFPLRFQSSTFSVNRSSPSPFLDVLPSVLFNFKSTHSPFPTSDEAVDYPLNCVSIARTLADWITSIFMFIKGLGNIWSKKIGFWQRSRNWSNDSPFWLIFIRLFPLSTPFNINVFHFQTCSIYLRKSTFNWDGAGLKSFMAWINSGPIENAFLHDDEDRLHELASTDESMNFHFEPNAIFLPEELK
jgi:hypothetical protein